MCLSGELCIPPQHRAVCRFSQALAGDDHAGPIFAGLATGDKRGSILPQS
jgi:hypothetical protein